MLHHVWSNHSEFVAFLWFVICALVQVLFFSLIVNFSVAIFKFLSLD